MAFELASFQDPELDGDYVGYLVDQQAADTAAHYGRLWDYFRNPLVPAVGVAAGALNANSRPYFQAQEVGLPARITGVKRFAGTDHPTDLQRKEVVIENDIAWRIHTMVDFLFGRPTVIRSLAADSELADLIERVITAMLESNGGVSFLQELALFGSVYGFVDIALRTPAGGEAVLPAAPLRPASLPSAASGVSAAGRRPGTPETDPEASERADQVEDGRGGPKGDGSRIDTERALATARNLQLETIEAPRVLPILADDDYRTIRYWIQRFDKHPARLATSRRPWMRLPWGAREDACPDVVEAVEILGGSWWQRYEDRRLVAEGPNLLGRLPVVHVQNMALPGSYHGLGDVAPLIPLQDELNTRLSDRAHRVTYQSFKMYLGKGIDDFLERPVGPGQMWATQNLNASIEEFGSDSGSPSEDIHIDQVRQAMDKVSGVTPVAAGLIRGNVGNLTSGTALKVVLSGLLARTAKKRLTYSAGLQRIVEIALEWMNVIGVLPTVPEDRRIEVHWPSPLPVDEGEQLRNAQIKAQLGVPADRILAELGYERGVLDTEHD